MYRTFGAPSGAFGGRYGVQSGTESRMSRLIFALGPLATVVLLQSEPRLTPTSP